jgi:hypothetical protein
MGVGVLFSAIPLFLFQGGLTVLAFYMGEFLSPGIVNEITATGGLLLIGLGINILEIKNIKILNILPSLFVIALLYWIFV